MTTARETLQTLVTLLRQRIPDLLAVYRYGSFDTPMQRPGSDIDLGLLADKPLDAVRLFDLAGELATAAGRDVDLVDLIVCPTALRAQIVATGERLLCTDHYRCEDFATTAFSRYAHLNEARRGILDDMQTRQTVHDE